MKNETWQSGSVTIIFGAYRKGGVGPDIGEFAMKNLLFATIAFVCAPLAFANKDAAYPVENVPEFVFKKLDVTSLPEAVRPKAEKRKKTFGDYGYQSAVSGEKEMLISAPSGPQIRLRILEQSAKGIYACFTDQAPNSGDVSAQRVVLLKRKDVNGLLKGRDTFKEFDQCPAIPVESGEFEGSAY
jgi:hypothetical protein